jgi:hypothetical protein
MTLAEFVTARLVEHWEQAQRSIGAAQWDATHAERDIDRDRAQEAKKAAEREIRVIEAQRRTLARHTGCGTGWGYCDKGERRYVESDGCPDLADLAAPDHEHTDFNPVWKTEETS